MSGVSFQALLTPRPITYATWNPSDKQASVTLTNSNLTATGPSGTTYNMARATQALPASGKVYFELTATAVGGISAHGMARGSGSFDITLTTGSPYPGGTQDSANNVSFISPNGVFKNDSALFAGSFTTADILQYAWDGATGSVWIGKNNTWFNSGNPSAGTGAVTTLTGTQYPVCALRGSASVTANFGASAFTYSVPSGFSAGLFT